MDVQQHLLQEALCAAPFRGWISHARSCQRKIGCLSWGKHKEIMWFAIKVAHLVLPFYWVELHKFAVDPLPHPVLPDCKLPADYLFACQYKEGHTQSVPRRLSLQASRSEHSAARICSQADENMLKANATNTSLASRHSVPSVHSDMQADQANGDSSENGSGCTCYH